MSLTEDPIRRGELTLLQPTTGYRFTLDALILADFAAAQIVPAPDLVLDLGTGCGIIGLLLMQRWSGSRGLLLEIQPELAALALQNVERNRLGQRVETCCVDLRDLEGWSAALDALGSGSRAVVCNPPYFKVGQGRLSPIEQVSVAKHEISCSLAQLLETCRAVLAPGDGVALIHASAREQEILDGLQRGGMGACKVRPVLPLPDRPSTRVLIAATQGAPPSVEELPALLVELEPGNYALEMRRVLGED
jgi:tRNA1Val (adenine37-N6)-methyltransferase